MKKILIALFAIGTFLNVSAQQKDPKAKALMDEVTKNFKKFSSIKTSFVYRLENKAGKVLSTKKGVVDIKGIKYNISFGDNKIISDGTTVWNYDPSAKEVTINNANNSSSAITPQKLFTNFYDIDFMYMMAADKKFGNKIAKVVLLQPIDSKKAFSRIYLWIDPIAKSILGAHVVEKAGNRISYEMSSLKTNIPMTDANFSFNQAKFPGVEVVDLR